VIAPTRPDGMVWDPNGATTSAKNPDPFCRLTTDDNRSRSSSVDGDTLMPSWNDNVTPTFGSLTGAMLTSAQSRWSITVEDQDNMSGSNETVCTLNPHPTAAELTAGMVKLSGGSCIEVVLKLNCQ